MQTLMIFDILFTKIIMLIKTVDFLVIYYNVDMQKRNNDIMFNEHVLSKY